MRVKILKNEQVAAHAYKMTLAAPVIAKAAQPGQFVMVKCADGIQPLLRRPLGVHNVKGSEVEILYEIIGEGTKLLSQKKSGQALDIIGPLGTGFDVGHSTTNILIAGGMGVAPLLFLAKKINKSKVISQKSQVLVLIGAKTKQEILCEKEFKKLGCNIKVATDDGSAGHKGFVTDLLVTCDLKLVTDIYACGPKLMLKAISELSKRQKIPAQVSLEEHMACGIGACLGCIVKTKSGQKRACKEGPVFDAREIIWKTR